MGRIERSTFARSIVVVVAVLVTAAGACRQEWDGPLPSPDELGADPLPYERGGMDAVYAVLMGPGAGDDQCYRVLTFTPDGALTTSSVCTAGSVGDALDRLGNAIATGDYASRDGVVWVRTVSWDWLAEELVLDQFEAVICGTEYRTGSVFELVAGAPPPGTPTCPTP